MHMEEQTVDWCLWSQSAAFPVCINISVAEEVIITGISCYHDARQVVIKRRPILYCTL